MAILILVRCLRIVAAPRDLLHPIQIAVSSLGASRFACSGLLRAGNHGRWSRYPALWARSAAIRAGT